MHIIYNDKHIERTMKKDKSEFKILGFDPLENDFVWVKNHSIQKAKREGGVIFLPDYDLFNEAATGSDSILLPLSDNLTENELEKQRRLLSMLHRTLNLEQYFIYNVKCKLSDKAVFSNIRFTYLNRGSGDYVISRLVKSPSWEEIYILLHEFIIYRQKDSPNFNKYKGNLFFEGIVDTGHRAQGSRIFEFLVTLNGKMV